MQDNERVDPPSGPASEQLEPFTEQPRVDDLPVIPPTDAPVSPAGRTYGLGTMIAVAVISALLIGSAAGLAGGLAGAWLVTHDRLPGPNAGTVRVVTGDTDEPVAAAAAAAVASVVNIDVTSKVSNSGSESEMLPEGHPDTPTRGNGSGVAFRQEEDGSTLIMTNAHVVKDATRIIVTGTDRVKHTGIVVGADAESDIAVVRIDASLPAIETGESGDLVVGQIVVAIGSPFGLTHSVSSGVVSAIGRALTRSLSADPGVYPLVDVIQTDAAINPGNSGGALVDRHGRLVGINTAIYSESGTNDGIGFAVPVDKALSVAEQLIKSGVVEHPFLGIVGRAVTEDLAASENLPVSEGAIVIEVARGTEAEKSDIRPGDIIVGLEDEVIRSMDDLILQVRRRQVGDVVTVSLYRGTKRLEIEMAVGVKPASLDLPSEDPTTPPAP
ncbi:MAG: trypsin-like peptidase domain-containing protein [Actinomycetota bacterium]|nr:trypsin-like peptidase domain-containing protein [Actinomycetota bacterium]MDZ4179551.1 trypsin-like peptidase domain-containing protein [Coriobacteriia bacterium]